MIEYVSKGKDSVPPPPKVNGGLYTGEPFAKNAPWGNIHIPPTTHHYINEGLRSANPPPGAITQYPHYVRPGNNWQEMRGITMNTDYGALIPCSGKGAKKKEFRVSAFDPNECANRL